MSVTALLEIVQRLLCQGPAYLLQLIKLTAGGESGELRSDMALASSSTDDEVLSSALTTADSGLVDAQIASANGAGSADPTGQHFVHLHFCDDDNNYY